MKSQKAVLGTGIEADRDLEEVAEILRSYLQQQAKLLYCYLIL